MPATWTVRKRKFGQALARLREASGHTTEEAGSRLRRNASQISKIENGHNLCAYAEMAALLSFYEATDEQRAEVEALWTDAKQDSRRIQGSSAVPPKFRAFLRSEADAATVRTLQASVIPGLLQTSDYAMAVLQAASDIVDISAGVERATAARLARQELLQGPHALTLHALIDEGAIRRVVGGRSIMADQLRRILVLGEQDNVTIQVIPVEAGAYGTMSGPVTILSFDDPEGTNTVYLEYPGGGEWVDAKEDVQKFIAMFDRISAQALPAAESAALVRARAEELEGL
jgi:transcriptional regulator with XRE-family HTH domain